jgi:hypothetical protein
MGEQLRVTHIGGVQYKLECFNCTNGPAWETIGFMSESGRYFKGVFRYTVYDSRYKDHVGIHKSEIYDGKILIKGGWDTIGEFGKGSAVWIKTGR